MPAYREPVLAAEGVVVSGLAAAAAVGADIVTAGWEDEAYCSTVTFAALRDDYALAGPGQTSLITEAFARARGAEWGRPRHVDVVTLAPA